MNKQDKKLNPYLLQLLFWYLFKVVIMCDIKNDQIMIR